MTFLLDTNVVSELRRSRPDAAVAAWWAGAPASRLYLSALTIGELHRGIARLRTRRDHAQAQALSDWLAGLVRQFGDRVLPVDAAVAEIWGRLPQDQPVPAVDGLIAATAIRHGLTLVTRNTCDVVRTGVPVLDPFAG